MKNYLPLTMALSHLRIRIDDDMAYPPCLVQDIREVPMASDSEVEAWFAADEHPEGTLPEGVELQLLTMSCPAWADDAMYAFAGLTAFGARNLPRAAACARRALTANRTGTLGRQLVKLLTAKGDPRKPFGVPVEHAPDVVRMLS